MGWPSKWKRVDKVCTLAEQTCVIPALVSAEPVNEKENPSPCVIYYCKRSAHAEIAVKLFMNNKLTIGMHVSLDQCGCPIIISISNGREQVVCRSNKEGQTHGSDWVAPRWLIELM